MSGTAYFGAVAALAIVLLVIVVLGRLADRFQLPLRVRGAKSDGMGVSVRSSTAIDGKRRLVIVTWDGRDGLILLGPHGDVMLGWRDGSGVAT